jgi:hypothetical protein
MVGATRTAFVITCYLIVPLALYIGLKALGAFTGYLFITNVLIGVLALFALLIALFFAFVWKFYLRALALICSVSIVVMSGWFIGQDAIHRHLYMVEALMTPHFGENCVPSGGILLNDDTLRVCRRYDFGDYEKLIVKVSGAYPTERLIDDINSGKVKAAAGGDEWWVRPNTVIGYPLLSDYYLFEVYLCGKGKICGPL